MMLNVSAKNPRWRVEQVLMGEVMDLPLKFHLIALSSLHEVSQMIVITS